MINKMAAEVWLQVFKYLDLVDKGRAATVCKEWRSISQDPILWQSIDLSGRQDAASQLQLIPRIPQLVGKLQKINLEFSHGVAEEHIKLLTPFDLRVANFNACQSLTDAAFMGLLPHCPLLVQLELYWNTSITDATLFTLSACCPALEHLNLRGCQRITDGGVATLAECCSELTFLDLTRCVLLTDDSVSAVCLQCPLIHTLLLYADAKMTDKALEAAARLKLLEVIDLCGARNITDVGLKALGNCKRLREVNLSWCVQVGDEGVEALVRQCNTLESLSLHGNKNVTDVVVDALSDTCADTLHALDVNGCSAIKQRSKDQLLKKLPKLTTFRIHK